jgi:hypothetical protein
MGVVAAFSSTFLLVPAVAALAAVGLRRVTTRRGSRRRA